MSDDLQFEPALWRAVFDAAPDAMLLIEPSGLVRAVNREAQRLFGYSRQELLGADVAHLLPLPFGKGAISDPAVLAERITLAERPGYEPQGRRKDGVVLPLWLTVGEVSLGSGRWHVLTVRDLSTRKALDQQNVQEQRLAAIRELSSGLAHESRNALQRAQSCLELLMFELGDRPKGRDLVDRVQQALDHLLELYEEVRTYSAPMRLELAPVDVEELIRAAWADARLVNAEAHARLEIASASTDARVQADRDRLLHLLRLLLKNAVQAIARDGLVQVRFAATMIGSRDALTISICDDGEGIAPEMVSKLFLPFRTTRTRGMGLGLAISKRIVQSHGGHIEYLPQSGAGARFDITLPRLPIV